MPGRWFAVLCAWTALSGLTLSEGVVSGRVWLVVAGGAGSALVAGLVLWPMFRHRR
jgi:hypothetical protein